MKRFLTKDSEWNSFYSHKLIEQILWLWHRVDIENIFWRNITNNEFEKLLLDIVEMSNFDEVSFYVQNKDWHLFKKTFKKDWTIELKFIKEFTKESHLNLFNVTNQIWEVTSHWYFVSKVPIPWIWEDFVMQLSENIFIAWDNYSHPEDISVYLWIIEMIAMSIWHIIIQQRLIEDLLRDELTHLYNRKAWNRMKFQNWHLIALDIDDFKSVNDTFWHDVWDEVLEKIATSILDMIRKDDKAFRLGWEEFCIYIKEKNIDIVLKIAERIRQNISDLLFKANPLVKQDVFLLNESVIEFQRTVSIWISEIIDWKKEESLKEADENLYLSKTTWKDRIHYQKKLKSKKNSE